MPTSTDPILVTGATGFTGGHLARRLLRSGHAVRVLARDDSRADGLEREGFEVVRGDLTDAGAIDRAVAGTRLVYHIAALFRPAIKMEAERLSNVRPAPGTNARDHIIGLKTVTMSDARGFFE